MPCPTARIACSDLRCHVQRHVDLALVLLATVRVRDIDHDLRPQAGSARALGDTIAATLRAGDRQPDRRSEAGSDPAGTSAPTDTPASITPTGTDA